jgi:hypothetical protein
MPNKRSGESNFLAEILSWTAVVAEKRPGSVGPLVFLLPENAMVKLQNCLCSSSSFGHFSPAASAVSFLLFHGATQSCVRFRAPAKRTERAALFLCSFFRA